MNTTTSNIEPKKAKHKLFTHYLIDKGNLLEAVNIIAFNSIENKYTCKRRNGELIIDVAENELSAIGNKKK